MNKDSEIIKLKECIYGLEDKVLALRRVCKTEPHSFEDTLILRTIELLRMLIVEYKEELKKLLEDE